MSFNNYKLFTCTSLFEPAVFSSHGGLDKEAVVGLRAEVSLPGAHSPEVIVFFCFFFQIEYIF